MSEEGLVVDLDSVNNTSDELEVSTADVTSSEDEVFLKKSRVTTRIGATDLISVLTKATINLFLPFVNGMMLGFGEIFAHELGWKWGFTGARIFIIDYQTFSAFISNTFRAIYATPRPLSALITRFVIYNVTRFAYL